jgi:putative nucleotidyltransferase with HDIG domain
MINRIKQVISALTACILPEDEAFVALHLNKEEQNLFWNMNLPDQRHALNVAYAAGRMAQVRPGACNQEVAVKCALLHDVGKVSGDVSTADKIIAVLAHHVCPTWVERWGQFGRGSRLENLRHAFFIYFHHAERSAALLTDIHTGKLMVTIVRNHHKVPAEDDPPELAVLRAADRLH